MAEIVSCNETSMLHGRMALPPGFRFHPSDEELVGYYLYRKVRGLKFEFECISDIELYKWEPWDLPDKSCLKTHDLEWYFFSPRDKKYPNGSRTNRATVAGYWKATGKDRRIRKVRLTTSSSGMKKTLVFYKGRAPHGERTGWVMHEYRLDQQEYSSACSSQKFNAFVLCRVFKKDIVSNFKSEKDKELEVLTESSCDHYRKSLQQQQQSLAVYPAKNMQESWHNIDELMHNWKDNVSILASHASSSQSYDHRSTIYNRQNDQDAIIMADGRTAFSGDIGSVVTSQYGNALLEDILSPDHIHRSQIPTSVDRYCHHAPGRLETMVKESCWALAETAGIITGQQEIVGDDVWLDPTEDARILEEMLQAAQATTQLGSDEILISSGNLAPLESHENILDDDKVKGANLWDQLDVLPTLKEEYGCIMLGMLDDIYNVRDQEDKEDGKTWPRKNYGLKSSNFKKLHTSHLLIPPHHGCQKFSDDSSLYSNNKLLDNSMQPYHMIYSEKASNPLNYLSDITDRGGIQRETLDLAESGRHAKVDKGWSDGNFQLAFAKSYVTPNQAALNTPSLVDDTVTQDLLLFGYRKLIMPNLEHTFRSEAIFAKIIEGILENDASQTLCLISSQNHEKSKVSSQKRYTGLLQTVKRLNNLLNLRSSIAMCSVLGALKSISDCHKGLFSQTALVSLASLSRSCFERLKNCDIFLYRKATALSKCKYIWRYSGYGTRTAVKESSLLFIFIGGISAFLWFMLVVVMWHQSKTVLSTD